MAILVVLYDTSNGRYLTQKIGSAHISDGAIVSGKIGSGQIGTPHLVNAIIISSKIASGQVGIPHIYPNAITSAKIAPLAVGTPHIAALAIVSGKVASGGLSPLTSGKIWAGFTGNFPREENKPTVETTGIIVSDTLRNSNDAEKSTTLLVWTKLKEVRLNADLPACRLKYTGWRSAASYYVEAAIYKNGVELIVQRLPQTKTTYSEDFAGWESGDLIQLYGKALAGNSAHVEDMRFYYSLQISKIGATTLTTPLLSSDDPTISMTNQDP